MSSLEGKKILVSAGPTYEKIDDVRFIGNFSSGKMGFAIAESAINSGLYTTLVTGPTKLNCSKGINRIDVMSAKEMYNEITPVANDYDIIVMAAAVADYTPEKVHKGKLKKDDDELIIKLKKTKDILKELGENKRDEQLLVGFALESENILEYAKGKLEKKNCDIIVANMANQEKSGFSGDYNTIIIIDSKGNTKAFEPMEKSIAANEILRYCEEFLG